MSENKTIERLIWPDDAYVGVGGAFGKNQRIVSTIVPIKKDGGLGPSIWFDIRSAVYGSLGEVNAHYLSAIVYAEGLVDVTQQ